MDFTPVYERRVTATDEGTDWLYIDPATKERHHVEISAVPNKAQRIRIQHLDRDQRGRQEWVPAARAKVPWDLRRDYEATTAAWDALERHRPPSPHSDTAAILIDDYLDVNIAEIYYNGATGVLEIRDLDALSRACGVPAAEICAHEDTVDDGTIYIPWPFTLQVLRGLYEQDPRPALQLLASHRTRAEKFANRVAANGDPWWVQEAREGDKWAKRLLQAHNSSNEELKFLRSLMADDTPSLAEDFLELRNMYLDLVRLVPAAADRIKMVRAKVSNELATELLRLAKRPLPESAHLLHAERPGSDGYSMHRARVNRRPARSAAAGQPGTPRAP